MTSSSRSGTFSWDDLGPPFSLALKSVCRQPAAPSMLASL
eukprot:CAMPEP_0194591446 /NCGR_PEP_ID=MMETSP0292-20121207/22081_1 /TAXON_ID=39354 /ORGANISM="Heterosigma akashiwo, Strain CCMP2393" /LENGTH=39 /DNA_ID= /DNA_START= /DNA_END= /DNA_ORIENTATION=